MDGPRDGFRLVVIKYETEDRLGVPVFGAIDGDRAWGTLVPSGRYSNLRGSEAGPAPSATVRLQAAHAEGWRQFNRTAAAGDKSV